MYHDVLIVQMFTPGVFILFRYLSAILTVYNAVVET